MRLQVDVDELKMCDACGRHNHFRTALGQERVRLLLCGGCKQRRYCSAECQRKHWPLHKQTCKSIAAGSSQAPGTPANPQDPPEHQAPAEQTESAAGATAPPDYASWGVRQLKEHLAARGVDWQQCTEKSELVQLAAQHP